MRAPAAKLWLQNTLAARPLLANRLLTLLGAPQVERLGRQGAIKAAQDAYKCVPFYRTLYESHGFNAARMRRLTWDDFQWLPSIGKDETITQPEDDLVDTSRNLPADDCLLGQSSGTTGEPVTWPTGWEELAATRAYFHGFLRELGGDRARTAIVMMMPVEGCDLSGNIAYRMLYSLKERTRWPFEVFPTGERADDVIAILRYAQRQRYQNLYLIGFPGTVEALLNRLDELAAADSAQAFDWTKFTRRRIMMGGQLVAREIRDRVRAAWKLDERDLISEEVAYSSSDTGQLVAHTTPFTQWLERYLADRPALWDELGLPEEHRNKPLMEFVHAMALFTEVDASGGLLLTTWKHRPLVRYRSNDQAWLCSGANLLRLLDQHARGWRDDFASYGYSRNYIPAVSTLGVIQGRADDVVIVNSANIAPDTLRASLAEIGALPRLHHFKHAADHAHPNDYYVYLELRDGDPANGDPAAQTKLANEWRDPLLAALLAQPANTDLVSANYATPVILTLVVRSHGQDEFSGDDQLPKKAYTLRKARQPIGVG